MRSLTLQDLFGYGSTESSEVWENEYELNKDDFDWVVSELDLVVQEENGIRFVYDPDDEELLGEFVEDDLVLYTDLNLEDLFEDEDEDSELEEHIRRNGQLDFRYLVGRATKQYQNNLIVGITGASSGDFASPVSGTGGNPVIPPQSVLNERLVKRVNSKGRVKRIQDRKTRKRKATQTTGMSTAKRKQIARKAARTKKRSKMIGRRALRKRKKALRKRKAMGIR